MNRYFAAAIVCQLFIFLAVGCSVDPFSGSGEPSGSLYIETTDTNSIELVDAMILIDGVERPERTPAYIHGISAGDHQVINKLFGYKSDTSIVEVVLADTVPVSSVMEIVTTGTLNFTSQSPGARLLVDGQTLLKDGQPIISPSLVELGIGTYLISAYLAGHATISPVLPEIEIVRAVETQVEFTLEQRESSLQPGGLAFPFELENDDGRMVSLSDLTGHVILLNFWTVNCVPCLREFPGIDSVYQRHAADGFRVLAINPMYDDSRDGVVTYRTQHRLTFELLLDWTHEVTNQYGVRGLPVNVLIDRTGTIHEYRGGITQGELEEKVVELLGEQ